MKAELAEMIREAHQVQESVDKLLDLKQKRASLVEASTASKHAEDAAAQTRLMKFFGVYSALAVSFHYEGLPILLLWSLIMLTDIGFRFAVEIQPNCEHFICIDPAAAMGSPRCE